ncbi:hypothetical protein [Azotobacter vinelandii]
MNHDEVLQNRAEFRSDEVREADDFSLGIAIVLQCLRFAEEQGAIPELPDDWWSIVEGVQASADIIL